MEEDDDFAVEEDDFVVQECEAGYLALPCRQRHRRVPNCCAVCLCPYEVGECVVWSSNARCRHAFHEDCVVGWLTKMRDGAPCPCCRQEFCVDLVDDEAQPPRQKVVTWASGVSFDERAISFR